VVSRRIPSISFERCEIVNTEFLKISVTCDVREYNKIKKQLKYPET